MKDIPAYSRAVVLDGFGDASRLRLREVRTPSLARSGQLLVRARATSVNPIEWKTREGMGLPGWAWRRVIGRDMVLGIDFAGTVVAACGDAGGFKPGDEVMGALPRAGAYADHLVVEPNDPRAAIEKRPLHVPAERAALVPFASLVAYAGLVTYGRLPRHAADARVLVVGASGGVGHLAVQMAKHGLGVGHVVGVTSSRNAEFVRKLGADDIIPHDHVPVEAIPERYPEWSRSFDLILDGVGLDAYFKIVAPRLLKPTGRFVSAALPQVAPGRAGEDVGFWGALRLVGVLGTRLLRGRYALITGLIGGLATKGGFSEIVEWLAAGKLTPHLAAAYDLDRIGDAHRASETGRTVGKIGVRISPQPPAWAGNASTASGDPDAERLERPLASAS